MKRQAARRLLNSIAANVRMERLRREWTQSHLAEAAELTARFVGEIERGTVNMRVVTLAALANAFQLDPGKLFLPATKASARPPGRPHGIVERRPRTRTR